MPKPTCQLNLTLDVPTAEWVERVARQANVRPSGAGRLLMEERLKLQGAGWELGDAETAELLAGVIGLKPRDREAVRALLKKS